MSALDLTGEFTDSYLETYRDHFKSIEKIGYYIHDQVSKIENPSYYSWSHWDGHETAIHKAFSEIDPHIDLDFHETNNILEAQIHIYRVSPYPGIPNNVYGFAAGSHEVALIPSKANKGLFQSAVWSDFPDDYDTYYSNNPFLIDENGYDFGNAQWQDVFTIIHEIGHALGLSHPQSGGEDDPWGGHHNSEDTVMSYNANISYNEYGIFAHAPSWSSEDISHLKLIWGDENVDDDYLANLEKDSYPIAGISDPITGVSNSGATITKPSKFKKKLANKITNFDPLKDALSIDIESFAIDRSATFAAGKNKKAVKKKLAKQDFDFLYDEKKGGLYFNENGADKGFGDGGIIAILKGAPDLTSTNLEFF